jgi:hypothetical protein
MGNFLNVETVFLTKEYVVKMFDMALINLQQTPYTFIPVYTGPQPNPYETCPKTSPDCANKQPIIIDDGKGSNLNPKINESQMCISDCADYLLTNAGRLEEEMAGLRTTNTKILAEKEMLEHEVKYLQKELSYKIESNLKKIEEQGILIKNLLEKPKQ